MSTRSKKNQRSQKAMMRDALQTMERGLGSLIAARYEGVTAGSFVDVMIGWQNMARRALGHTVEERECICARCGIRHGLSEQTLARMADTGGYF